jgi:3-deoxy-manno-octulosonate cytidylyltransferase (CMP-KDO synthetase)
MMSTLRRRIDDPADFQNPNVTKVVVDREGFALYFSRAPIPFARDRSFAAPAWRHVGLYVYRRDCLLQLARLPQTELERSEALEQLRALEHGIRILAVETQHDSIGVDTEDDLERVRRLVPAARVWDAGHKPATSR